MIPLEDKRGGDLTGAYKLPYDPRPVLRRLETEDSPTGCREELWNELHHQGDVGDAAYVVVPYLVQIAARNQRVDWNLYALVGTIEIERHRETNPPVPDWLLESYRQALRELLKLALRDLPKADDQATVKMILGVLALAKNQHELGAFILHSDTSEIEERNC